MSDTNVLLSLVGVIIMQCTNHSISPSGNCSKKEYEKIIEQIISNIQSGNYKVGDKLPAERDLASTFSTSRNSAREALRVLENMGIVESRQGSGTYISGNASNSISTVLQVMKSLNLFNNNELFRFRMGLDKLVCDILMDNPESLNFFADKADSILNEPTHNAKEENEQDIRFHLSLVEATENRLLILLMKSASVLVSNMIESVRDVLDDEMKEKLFLAHKNIVSALRSGNIEHCFRAIEHHYITVDEIIKRGQLKEFDANRVYKDSENVDEVQEKDALTGLYVKDIFFQKAEEYIATHKDENLVLWASDIQGLRYVNESYGTGIGDKVICAVAHRRIKDNKVILGGRIGGDKFCFLLQNVEHYLEDVNRILIEDFDANLPVPNLSVKNGIYRIKKNDMLSAHSMYVRAVIALQSIKNSYTTMVIEYSDDMRKKILNSRQIQVDAKDALATGAFCVYLQPKIDLAANNVAGAEALVRWIHPELGMLSPGVFIPIFEQNGFITKLDLWIWENVCRTLFEWKVQGLPLVPISVNVSRNSFEDPELASKIIQLVDTYELDHGLFEIEITEYACLENMENVQKTIKTLHDAGFVISLDDFGTGYSSMVVLSKLDIDIMKLDMSLIANDDTNSKRSALEFSLQLAKMMNMRTVAEGVETEQQVNRIRSLGGDYIQGYYYSKPLPKDDFLIFLGELNK